MWYTKWCRDTYTVKSYNVMYDQIILKYKSYIRENSRFWQPQMEYGYYPVKCMYLNGIFQCESGADVYYYVQYLYMYNYYVLLCRVARKFRGVKFARFYFHRFRSNCHY